MEAETQTPSIKALYNIDLGANKIYMQYLLKLFIVLQCHCMLQSLPLM